VSLNFEWDREKAEGNLQKHGVSFEEAATIFRDLLSATVADPDPSHGEERFLTIGLSYQNRLVVVAHADLNDRIHIISARRATRAERRAYEEAT